VLVSEIELALRALIRLALSEAEITVAASRSLATAYKGEENVPATLEDMTFDNYRSLISHGENWPALEPVLGGTRARTSGKLKDVGEIRNDLFHFRRELTLRDHQTLAAHRDWLLSKIKLADGRRSKESA
jgi:hypothetical protein